MSQQTRLGKHATTVRNENDETIVRYHETDILKFNDERIELNTGGWFTATTKTRLNQAAFQFGLFFKVYQSKGLWYVTTARGGIFSFGQSNVLHFAR